MIAKVRILPSDKGMRNSWLSNKTPATIPCRDDVAGACVNQLRLSRSNNYIMKGTLG